MFKDETAHDTFTFKGRRCTLETLLSSSSSDDVSLEEEIMDGENKSQDVDDGRPRIHTHYVILSHGIMGNPVEMGNIENAVNVALENKNKNKNKKDDDESDPLRVVIHSGESNFKKTHDGIAKGGTRLSNEIQIFIKRDLSKHYKSTSTTDLQNKNSGSNVKVNNGIIERHVSLSMVGYSLGGLYMRYAVSCLPTEMQAFISSKGGTTTMRILLHYNTFVTTAAPHLGCASHTFVKLPRFVEKIIGCMFLQTGKDLFEVKSIKKKKQRQQLGHAHDGAANCESLIYEMGTNYERFLKPLSKFKKRVAYVNAFKTDFQVPTVTAGFLSKKSSHEHTILRNDQSLSPSPPSFVVAVLQTTQMDNCENKVMINNSTTEREANDFEISTSLDKLGWTKIFIDSREMYPIPGIPKILSFSKSNMYDGNRLFSSETVTSKDIKKIMTSSIHTKDIPIPLGHCMLIANKKSKGAEKFYSSGKPIVNFIAKTLVEDMLK